MTGHPCLGHFLGLSNLRQGHLLGQDIADFSRLLVTPNACTIGPHVRLYVVLGHPLAVMIHDGQVKLGIEQGLIGGLMIPPRRLAIVPGDAFAAIEHIAQNTLGIGITLVRRLAEPRQRLIVVPGDTLAMAV